MAVGAMSHRKELVSGPGVGQAFRNRHACKAPLTSDQTSLPNHAYDGAVVGHPQISGGHANAVGVSIQHTHAASEAYKVKMEHSSSGACAHAHTSPLAHGWK
eukprot:1156131-Pelagomonas_calceolata.AAC.8